MLRKQSDRVKYSCSGVNAQLCNTWSQPPKAKWEKPSDTAVVWKKNYTYFKSSERLAPGLTFQSIYKKIFTYSLMFSLNAHTREDALFSVFRLLCSMPRWFMYSFEHSCSCGRGERNSLICWFREGHRNAAYHSLGSLLNPLAET